MIVIFVMLVCFFKGFFKIVVNGLFLVCFKKFCMLILCKSLEFDLLVWIIKKWGIMGFIGVVFKGFGFKCFFFLFDV